MVSTDIVYLHVYVLGLLMYAGIPRDMSGGSPLPGSSAPADGVRTTGVGRVEISDGPSG